ncbi:type II toxin-antitoxin system VapC family toxin [Natronosalvus halobius]|uniref:type II toxin-antitoxin system VapC family toxin n=1 Tax=Natronosalvus halobius TaxID=2953746 RepID=UPI0020A07060|nr:PIN domain-containing protein [Natronosalvus halobius]USZ73534.1 PIN domain-containing protein [Natronosalvus halobius]
MSQGTPIPLFVDTGGFYAAYVEDDANHTRASAVFDAIRAGEYGPIFTSRYVLAELATVILYRKSHHHAVSTLKEIRASETINVVPVTGAMFDAAYERFVKYDDQEIAFFEHLGGALAREYEIEYVFTFDPSDFHTMGLTVVPDDPGEGPRHE